MNYFVDVIVPLALPTIFTYRIDKSDFEFVQIGCRVVVPFGNSKYYTAVAVKKHHDHPIKYEAKHIYELIDTRPKFTEQQLQLWEFISSYYMSTIGEVYRAAVPPSLILENETILYFNNSKTHDLQTLSDEEYLIFEAMQIQPILKVEEVQSIINKKNILPVIQQLVLKDVLRTHEEVKETYKPKTQKLVRLNDAYDIDNNLQPLLEKLNRSEKQRRLVLTYFQLATQGTNQITVKQLLEKAGVSQAVFKGLVDKEVFEVYEKDVYRVAFDETQAQSIVLTNVQKTAYEEINKHFSADEIVLLHGITGSGKTEVYIQLIEEQIKEEKQVLFLVPEIALTTQLTQRLVHQFGKEVMVYHSRYSKNERHEVWMRMLENPEESKIIIGARSAVFLPFTNLGLVIIDEEHDQSYKQHDPSPRFHARDVAIVLAKQFNSKALLGSATPSLESYYNAYQGKYKLVELKERFHKVSLPDIVLVDLKESYKRKEMVGHFSVDLIDAINEVMYYGGQVILFQNRRGFSPVLECLTCGFVPKCQACDVSLTYHKMYHHLKCHYCGYTAAMPSSCYSCRSTDLSTKGFGTEQVEEELVKIFPNLSIARMDQDTTKGKFAFEKIIDRFKNKEIDVLVGTQMLAKGLDFENVRLVGIMNADNALYFPDFRAHERAFQMMVQVAGRAGRKEKGKVLIQTYNPMHNVIQQVTQNNYQGMFKEQMYDRLNFKYPPFYRLIRIQLKHVDYEKLSQGSLWLFEQLQQNLQALVLGPEEPSINRIRNQYLRNILIKIPINVSLKHTKGVISKTLKSFESIGQYRSIKVVVNVDYY